ncbi:unnamed protein product [Ilex paraguariensis]|uniref:F-box associated beta-propeller type 3 domain-containing protein n=1 Tax=Ilex paraguariensis TaxID=185542 RepID=A0ABC8TMG6_9AQUA
MWLYRKKLLEEKEAYYLEECKDEGFIEKEQEQEYDEGSQCQDDDTLFIDDDDTMDMIGGMRNKSSHLKLFFVLWFTNQHKDMQRVSLRRLKQKMMLVLAKGSRKLQAVAATPPRKPLEAAACEVPNRYSFTGFKAESCQRNITVKDLGIKVDIGLGKHKDYLVEADLESLLRFKAVSKSGYALVEHPDFISTHFNYSNAYRQGLLAVKGNENMRGDWNITSIFLHSLDNVAENVPFPSPSRRNNGHLRFLGSCNGLVCLAIDFISTIALWNPATRQYRSVKVPRVFDQFKTAFLDTFGFGFLPDENDHNVVRIPGKLHIADMGGGGAGTGTTVVWVYTLNSDSWRVIQVALADLSFGFAFRLPSMNGFLHWMARTLNNVDVIVSLDIRKKVFQLIALPNSGGFHGKMIKREIVVLKGSLSMILSSVTVPTSFEVWLMTEYGVQESWTKQFAIELGHCPRTVLCPVGVWKTGDIVFKYMENNSHEELLLYDCSSKEIKHSRLHEKPGSFRLVHNFVESLVSTDGGRGALEL